MSSYPYTEQRVQLEEHIGEHVMTILHEDGVYRHLRFAQPGTSMWHWDIITWPGHLTITGDIGDGFTFSREHDMLDWFDRTGNINPQYWGQKMPHTIKYRSYSAEQFKRSVREHAEYIREELLPAERVAFTAQLEANVFSECGWEETAREALDNFEFNAKSTGHTHRFTDTWEWDFTDYDHHYLLACWAIVWGLETYRTAKTAALAKEPEAA